MVKNKGTKWDSLKLEDHQVRKINRNWVLKSDAQIRTELSQMCIQNLDKSEIRWSQLYRLAVPGIKITVGGFFAPWLRNGEVSSFEACGRGYGDGTKCDLHDRVAVSLEAIACCLTFGSDYFIL